MQMPSISIQKSDASIGLRSHKPSMQIRQQAADLQIRQDHAGFISISTTASKLHIDQTEAFADANLKSQLRFAKDYLSQSASVVSQFVAKTAQQGEQLKRIENGTGAIARIAKQNSVRPEPQVTLGFMPRSMSQVKFRYQPSDVRITAPHKEPDIKVTRREPQIEIPKWQTEAYVRQKNHIAFEAVGTMVNRGL